jgi:hypothetical protein
MPYTYHGTKLNNDRLTTGICRCASTGVSHSAEALVGDDGLVQDPANLNEHLTTEAIGRKEGPRPFIFAVNKDRKLRIALDGDRPGDQNAVKHETLFHNEDVLAAGEVRFSAGIITEINDESGSYKTYGKMQTDPTFSDAFLAACEQAGVRIDKIMQEKLEGLARRVSK